MQKLHYLFISVERVASCAVYKQIRNYFSKYILSLQDDLVSCIAREMIKKQGIVR